MICGCVALHTQGRRSLRLALLFLFCCRIANAPMTCTGCTAPSQLSSDIEDSLAQVVTSVGKLCKVPLPSLFPLMILQTVLHGQPQYCLRQVLQCD